MHQDCKNETVLEMIRDDIKDIKGDVKELLGFKYRLAGAIMLGSFIVSALVSYFTRLIIQK